MQAYARRWIYVAVIYFCLGVSLGVFMAASHDHSLFPVHAHLNLLGWASMTLIAVIYHFFPQAGSNRLATVQFWMHNIALPITMLALALLIKGNAAIEPVTATGAITLLLSVFMFAGNVLWHRA